MSWLKKVSILIPLFLLIGCNSVYPSSRIFDTLTSRLKIPENIFKLDRVGGVTKLVSEAFSNFTNTKSGQSSGVNAIFTGFLKILGFDPQKIGAIAVNGLIFLAHLLGTSLMDNSLNPVRDTKPEEDINNQNPLNWILKNDELVKMISHITDRDLPEYVIEYVKEKSSDEETGCIQMLVCKISPFIWGMQKAFENTESVSFLSLPPKHELLKQTDLCNEKYPNC